MNLSSETIVEILELSEGSASGLSPARRVEEAVRSECLLCASLRLHIADNPAFD
jgi:hypothetical protein